MKVFIYFIIVSYKDKIIQVAKEINSLYLHDIIEFIN